MGGEPTIYLDNAATTPVDPRVAAVMVRYLTADGMFGNPSATGHAPGRAARAAVEAARAHVAGLVHASAAGVVWTSGATEAINLALIGAARARRSAGHHLVTCATEHAAVLDTCTALEGEGFQVTRLDPAHDGRLAVSALAAALRPDTVVVSIMHVNNETGVIQDVAAMGRLCAEHGVTFHVDAAQSAGKIPLDVQAACIDLLSLSAHKLHGPKGVGALWVRGDARRTLRPLLHGGGQQAGLRPGTLATHQIAGMGEAFRIAGLDLAAQAHRMAGLRDRMWQAFSALPGVLLNGAPAARAPGILNVTFEHVPGEDLLLALPDLALATGSACATESMAPSHVLRAMGRSDEQADAAIRLSVGRFTTAEEVDRAAARVVHTVVRLRG